MICGMLLGTVWQSDAGAPTIVSGSSSHTRTSGAESKVVVETVSFQAIRTAEGVVFGQGQVHLQGEEGLLVYSHFRIDCMLPLDDHTVILAGVNLIDIDPAYVGDTIAFAVRDRGEGQNAAPDEATAMFYSTDVGFELNCEVVLQLIQSGVVDPEERLLPAETGNIQIIP